MKAVNHNSVRIFLALVVGMLLVPVALQATTTGINLVNNGTFDNGSLDSWNLGANYCGMMEDEVCVPWQVDSSESHSGGYSALVEGNIELVQAVTPTATYFIDDVSFWLKQDPAVVFGYEFFYADGTNSFGLIFPEDTDWHQYQVASSINPDEVLIGVGFVSYSSWEGNGPTWLDDVVVDPPVMTTSTPEPASLLLMAAGLTAMAFSMRRFKSKNAE